MSTRFGRDRLTVALLGVLLVFLGATILANPGGTTALVVRLVGFACMVFALMSIVMQLLGAHAADFVPVAELAGAGMLLLVGTVLALYPAQFVRALFSVLGVLIVLSGIDDVMRSHRMVAADDQLERATLRIGIATIAIGLFVTFVPMAAASIVPIICGVALVVDGLSELYLAMRL